MSQMKKLDPGAKGWHIVENRWHYFFAGQSLCSSHTLTAEVANIPHLGPRRVPECKPCLDTVNKRKL